MERTLQSTLGHELLWLDELFFFADLTCSQKSQLYKAQGLQEK